VTIPFPDQSFDSVIATEVFEHVPDIDLLLREIRRIMRPKGVLFFTTPFVWPFHETPHDCQRWTAMGLQKHLKAAGFQDEQITCEGNWHSSLAQMIGLWVARAPMSSRVRRVLRYPAFAVQKILMRFEGNSEPVENSMPRCIFGTARL
jgi:SAM-dependent methyltransferase